MSPTSFSQAAGGAFVSARAAGTENAPAISNDAVTAAAKWRAESNGAPLGFPGGKTTYLESLWLKHGEIYRRAGAAATATLLL